MNNIKKYLLIVLLIVSYEAMSQTNTFPASGNVGIGTTNPVSQFVVSNGGSQNIEFGSNYIQSFNRSIPDYASMGLYASSYTFNNGAATFSGQVNANANIYISSAAPTVLFTNQLQTTIYGYIQYSGGTMNFNTGATGATFSGSIALPASGSINNLSNIQYGGFTWAGYNTGTGAITFANGSGTAGINFNAGLATFNAGVNVTTGNVGIGTSAPSEKLSVNGNIRAKKLIVTQAGWPDFVFSEQYKLKPLNDP